MSIPHSMKLCVAIIIAQFASVSIALPSAHALFHQWHVKEVFSNADGSVQFIEMFDSFSGDNFIPATKLTSNSDGVIKEFTFYGSNLAGSTAGKHLLIATSGFASLSGAVTPNYSFNLGGVSGPFFNPNATNITITYNGSNDSMTFTGASLPKDGVNSLTDSGAFGTPPGTPNITAGVNSPTNYAGQAGSVVLTAAPTGDYNGNHVVDAADYVLWRNTFGLAASPAGSGADGSKNGTIDNDDYAYWQARFGSVIAGSGSSVPEPATLLGLTALAAVNAFLRRHRITTRR